MTALPNTASFFPPNTILLILQKGGKKAFFLSQLSKTLGKHPIIVKVMTKQRDSDKFGIGTIQITIIASSPYNEKKKIKKLTKKI